MNLYEVDQEYKAIVAEIEENEGELTEELEAKFDSISNDRNTKISNILKYIRNNTSHGTSLQNEIDRLESVKNTLFKKQEWLKRYLTNVIGEGNKYTSVEGSVSWGKATSIDIVNVHDIPARFMTTPPIPEAKPNKLLIKYAINSGIKVPGAAIVTRKYIKIK